MRGFPLPETVEAEPELRDYLEQLAAYDPDAWEFSLETKASLEQYAIDDARPAPLKLGRRGVFVPDGEGKGRIRSADHPAERASFGFAAPPVELTLTGDDVSGTLFVPLDGKAAQDVELGSVALFARTPAS
jgi:hypothetical protein